MDAFHVHYGGFEERCLLDIMSLAEDICGEVRLCRELRMERYPAEESGVEAYHKASIFANGSYRWADMTMSMTMDYSVRCSFPAFSH